MMHQFTLKRVWIAVAAALLAVVFAASYAVPQERRAPESQKEVRLSYAPIVKRVAPAVVNVYVRHKVRQKVSPFFEDPFFRRFFGDGFGLERERVENSLGSGVIVSPDGVVVTNNHVIKGGGEAEIKVGLADKRQFPAEVVLKDDRTDLAVLRIDAPDTTFPYLRFEDSETLEVGDLVLAIGNPFGVGQTVTSGIVSALARTRVGVSDYQFFIQTDAAVNPGNSGGALVDMDGKLVGVNTAIYSRTGGSHGIGFAIPSNMVSLVVKSALKGGPVRRPWFGAKLQSVTPDIAESLGLRRPAGALVKRLLEDTPAATAELKPGDVIVQVDGKSVDDPRAFHYRFATKGIGGTVPLVVVRDGEKRTVPVALRKAPENPAPDTQQLQGRHPFSGATVANLSPALAEELSLEANDEGVIVLEIERGTPASRLGFLRPHDIVVAVKGTRVKSVGQLREVLGEAGGRWRISIKRGDRILTGVIGG